jgi:signal transduction histidine kinase/ActR/RegA family two-component response regulator
MRLRRTSVIVLVLVVAASIGASFLGREVRDENERRLLNLQADQMGQLVESMASSQQAQMVSTAVVLNAESSTAASFPNVVKGVSYPGQLWAVLRTTPGGVTVTSPEGGEPGSILLQHNRTADVDVRLEKAFAGEFAVVGLFGEGLDRRIALASGVPGHPGAAVAYSEVSLLGSVASGSSGQSMPEVQMALFAGSTPSSETLILATAPDLATRPRAVTRNVSIGGLPITLIVAAKGPLSGRVADSLPAALFVILMLFGLMVVWVVETSMRKRDRALALVAALAAKNDALDSALAERDTAEKRRRALEEELRRSQRLEAVGQLAGGIAHDFNNLLAAIMSYADLIADELGDHESREDVEEIRDAARRGAGLTRQLLQFSKTEQEQTEAVDLNSIVCGLQRLLQRTLGEEVELRTELATDLPAVAIDAGELEQVLMNLVVNARDAIDGPGTITITTDLVRGSDDAWLSEQGADIAVRLAVADTGSGMDPEVLERAFEPFFTTKARGRGTGLGLATAYGIIHRAGGKVSVQSRPGEGTVFQILLPAGTRAELVDEIDDDVRPANGSRNGVVLLVEDEDAVRRASRRMLERRGYTVLEASNGADALQLHADAEIDVLLTDVIMPGGLSGKDVADRLREGRPDLPVVYMSGYSADLLARRGVDATTPSVVVQKPFSQDDLLSAVADAFEMTAVRS